MYNGKRPGDGEQISKSMSQSGLKSATRLHEVGIASNRRSACYVNTFPGLVHTARHTMGVVFILRRDSNFGGERLRWER